MENSNMELEIVECSPEENEGQSGGLWNKGLRLGKKVLVTGIVLTSAPVILPPLMALSTLGFVFTVPFGFLFASYTCTEMLMSKLLRITEPASSVLGYKTLSAEEVGSTSDGGEVIEDSGYGGGDYWDAEEEEKESLVEETQWGGKMGIGLASKRDGETGGGSQEDKDRKEIVEGFRGRAQEGGYKEDGEEDFAKEKGTPLEDFNVTTGGAGQKEVGKGIGERVGQYREGSRDEQPLEVVSGVMLEASERSSADIGGSVNRQGNVDIVSVELNIEGSLEGKAHGERVPVAVENVAKLDEVGPLGGVSEDNEKAKKDKKGKLKHGIAKDSSAAAAAAANGTNQMKTKTQEIPVVGHDSKDAADETAPGQNPQPAPGILAEVHNGTKSSGLHVSPGISEIRLAKAPVENKSTTRSDEMLCSEKKIWEQLNAIRTIVGYRSTPHRSCSEELKALYLFTGVEPPAWTEGWSDIADVHDKLHCLMSIVGVK